MQQFFADDGQRRANKKAIFDINATRKISQRAAHTLDLAVLKFFQIKPRQS